MKAFFAILFSAFFLLTTMQEATFMLLYKLNEKSITEKYCVNKNVEGSCHLNKTIAKAENEDSKNPFSILNLKVKDIEIFYSQLYKIQEISLSVSLNLSQLKSKYYSSIVLDGFASSLIKPPTILG